MLYCALIDPPQQWRPSPRRDATPGVGRLRRCLPPSQVRNRRVHHHDGLRRLLYPVAAVHVRERVRLAERLQRVRGEGALEYLAPILLGETLEVAALRVDEGATSCGVATVAAAVGLLLLLVVMVVAVGLVVFGFAAE